MDQRQAGLRERAIVLTLDRAELAYVLFLDSLLIVLSFLCRAAIFYLEEKLIKPPATSGWGITALEVIADFTIVSTAVLFTAKDILVKLSEMRTELVAAWRLRPRSQP